MPLHVLGLLVIGGIGGIAILLHLLGLSRGLRFDDTDAAITAWNREFPDLPALDADLSNDHKAALIRTAQGPGLVWPMGADSTARKLDRVQVQNIPNGLKIRLGDFTAPSLRLRLSADQKTIWQQEVESSND